MNITFLIGNGFDLQCGMKTRYSDVYEEYQKLNTPLSIKLCEHFASDKENWSDFEDGIVTNAKSFSDIGELRACVEDFEEFIQNYIQKEDSRIWSQFEEVDFDNEFSRSINSFYEQLTLSRMRSLQFSLDSNPVCNFITLNYTDLLEKLIRNSIQSAPFDDANDMLGSFVFGKIEYPHGKCSTNIIVGAGSKEQFSAEGINLNELEARALVKPLLINAFDNFSLEQSLDVLKATDILCVFGASLGKSDVFWRDKIVMWLLESPKHQLIKCYKNGEKKRPRVASQIIDAEDAAVFDFINSLGLSSEVCEKIKKQVHVPLGGNLFNFLD